MKITTRRALFGGTLALTLAGGASALWSRQRRWVRRWFRAVSVRCMGGEQTGQWFLVPEA